VIVAMAVMGLVAAGASFVAPAASAEGLLPTTTTVAASPATSTAGDPVTLAATVTTLGLPGLGVTPTGSVAFTASDGSSTTSLGAATLGSCLLTACTASITTSAIPAGSTSVTASYAGDALSAASSGSASITVAEPEPEPEPDVETTMVCGSDVQTCTTDVIVSPDGTTTLTVSAEGGNQTVYAALFGDGELTCPGRDDTPPGAEAEFTNSSETSPKTVTYRLTPGPAAQAMKIAYHAHPDYLGCYGAPTPFNGFTNGEFGPATFDPEQGLYVAQIASCSFTDGQRPCFALQNNGNFNSNSGDMKILIHTPAGDPLFR
jgi:hypothetical protein